MRQRANRHGFTLVELIVTIVLLGAVAAVVIPRYASYTREARIAALNGLAGAIRSSVLLVRSRYIATGATTSPVVLRDGTTVIVTTTGAAAGIPRSTAGGIRNALNLGIPASFTYTAGAAIGTFNFPTAVTNCRLTYAQATGNVALIVAGC